MMLEWPSWSGEFGTYFIELDLEIEPTFSFHSLSLLIYLISFSGAARIKQTDAYLV